MKPRQSCCQHRYAGVGLFVDERSIAAAKTPNPYNPGSSNFDIIAFKTGESLMGKTFKLDWTLQKDANGHAQEAQVEFLEIEYHKVKGNYVEQNLGKIIQKTFFCHFSFWNFLKCLIQLFKTVQNGLNGLLGPNAR